MRRAAVLAALALVPLALASGPVWAQGPVVDEVPPCYTAFWVSEPVHFKLEVPWRMCSCCCCDKPLITGWRVEAMDFSLVFGEAFPEPRDPRCFEMIWDQKDLEGVQVAAGYYRIVVETTTGAYTSYVKIEEKTDCCCCWPRPRSCPCPVCFCEPQVKVYRAPSCGTGCCWPFPCAGCSLSIYIGAGDP